ncbi:MAG TPA: hypothetical protein DDZ81_14380 [Acetobacteraceae bacterium]|nr:hypothetical protein [Acetobacteraceae bacterium]
MFVAEEGNRPDAHDNIDSNGNRQANGGPCKGKRMFADLIALADYIENQTIVGRYRKRRLNRTEWSNREPAH